MQCIVKTCHHAYWGRIWNEKGYTMH